MPAPKVVETGFSTDVAVVTTDETVVVTLDAISTRSAGERVLLHGWVQFTTGTACSAVTLRLRRGTTTGGTLVGEANAENLGAAAGSTEEFSIDATDAPGEVAGQAYVLTVQQTAATGNGSALAGGISGILGAR